MSPILSRIALMAVTSLAPLLISAATAKRPAFQMVGGALGPVLVRNAEEKIVDKLGPPAPMPDDQVQLPDPIVDIEVPDPNIPDDSPSLTSEILKVVGEIVRVALALLLMI